MSVPHEGASESWSPRDELASAGLSPDMRVLRPEREAAATLHADLAAWEVRTRAALAEVVGRALARLGQVEP